MKKRKLKLFSICLSCILLFSVLLSGCVPQVEDSSGDAYCRLILSECDGCVRLERMQEVKRGQDAVFAFDIQNGYAFEGVNYGDYDITVGEPDELGVSRATLLLHNVRYSANLELRLKETEKTFTLSLNSSPYFRCETPKVSVKAGGSATFILLFQAEYTFLDVDYNGEYTVSGADAVAEVERAVTLTCKGVSDHATLSVRACEFSAEEPELPLAPEFALLSYKLNGGAFTDGRTEDSFTVKYALKNHYRPNTSIGTDEFAREGFTLLGWNTSADGSGEHVGLGSKAPVYRGESLRLYAEWAEETDGELFEYALMDRADLSIYYASSDMSVTLTELIARYDGIEPVAVITSYGGGSLERLVIPETVEGYEVVGVNTGAFSSLSELKAVVLPKTMCVVESRAFENCPAISEVYVYDNLARIHGDAFGDAVPKTLHINAAVAPVFGKVETGQFANKIEMLNRHDGEKPKMVFFGSCSTWYGVNAAQVEEEYSRYDVFNMGVIGGTCARYQVDLIQRYLNPGDVLVYLTELASEYQWLGSYAFDSRVFVSLENNYDLLATLDMRNYENVLDGLNKYLISKKAKRENEQETGSYDDYLDYVSERGDMLKFREGGYENHAMPYELPTVEKILATPAFENMKILFDELERKGVTSYFGFGPMNADGIDEERIRQLNELFFDKFEEKNIAAEMLNFISASVLPKEYFFDSNYHLSSEGAERFTESMINDLFLKLK